MWVDMSYMDGKGLLPTGLLLLVILVLPPWYTLSFCFDLAALGSLI